MSQIKIVVSHSFFFEFSIFNFVRAFSIDSATNWLFSFFFFFSPPLLAVRRHNLSLLVFASHMLFVVDLNGFLAVFDAINKTQHWRCDAFSRNFI